MDRKRKRNKNQKRRSQELNELGGFWPKTEFDPDYMRKNMEKSLVPAIEELIQEKKRTERRITRLRERSAQKELKS